MSQIIANQLATRMRLLKGDLPKPTDVMLPSLGSDESVCKTLRPPPHNYAATAVVSAFLCVKIASPPNLTLSCIYKQLAKDTTKLNR